MLQQLTLTLTLTLTLLKHDNRCVFVTICFRYLGGEPILKLQQNPSLRRLSTKKRDERWWWQWTWIPYPICNCVMIGSPVCLLIWCRMFSTCLPASNTFSGTLNACYTKEVFRKHTMSMKPETYCNNSLKYILLKDEYDRKNKTDRDMYCTASDMMSHINQSFW